MPLRAPDNCARHIVVLQARKEQMANSTRLRLPWDTLMLSVLRIVVGLLDLEHGTQKIFNFPPRPHPRPFELFTIVPGLAGVLELGGGILIVLGLFTRPVAFILSGEMAFAYFIGHFPKSFWPAANMGENAILLCFIFLYLATAGPGAWSIDSARMRNAPIR
jgi:putative oxidoreductase